MRKGKYSAMAGAVLAAAPLATNAAIVSASYDPCASGGISISSRLVCTDIMAIGRDTTNALPDSTIIVPDALPPHPIISLTAGETPVSTYYPYDGFLRVIGAGSGNYGGASALGFSTATTGSLTVSGFNPVTDLEVYALKLDQNGIPIATTNTTLLTNLASDINGANGNSPSTNVTASLVTGNYTNMFVGYDILLTSSGFTAGPGGTAELGFDFSSNWGERNPADFGITVTGIVAVPEPVMPALAIMAAACLLGRRSQTVFTR